MSGSNASVTASPPPAYPARSWLKRAVRFLWGYDFFVSYQWSSGGPYAVALAERLRDRGYDCFLDRSEFAAGDDWRREAQSALRHTSRLVIIATPSAVRDSAPVRHELEVFTRRSDRVIPIVFGTRFSDAERRCIPTLALIPPSTVDVVEPHERLSSGPSDGALDELVRAHRLLKRRSVRSGIVTLALLVLSAAVATATGFWRSAEGARAAEQVQRVAAQEAFRESQDALARNLIQSGLAGIRQAGSGAGLGDLARAYATAMRVGVPGDAAIPPDTVLARSVRRLMAGQGAALGLPLVHGEQIAEVDLGPRGRLVRTLTVNYDGEPSRYLFWDASTGQLLEERLSVDDFYFDVGMDRQWAAAVHWSGDTFQHLDLETGEQRSVPTGVPYDDFEASAPAHAVTRSLLAHAEADGRIRVWDVRGDSVLTYLATGLSRVDTLRFGPGGVALVAVGRDWLVVLDVEGGRATRPLDVPGLRGWHVDATGESILTVDSTGTVARWALSVAPPALRWSYPAAPRPRLQTSDDGHTLLVETDSGAVLLDGETGEALPEPSPEVSEARLRLLSPDGASILHADDSTLHVWDVATGARIGGPWSGWPERGRVSFAEGGGTIRWVSSSSRIATVHEMAIPERVLVLPPEVRRAQLSSDGRRVVATMTGETAQLWDLGSGRPTGDPLPLPQGPDDVSFSAFAEGLLTDSYPVPYFRSLSDDAGWIPVEPEEDVRFGVAAMPAGEIVAYGPEAARLWIPDEGWVDITLDDLTDDPLIVHVSPSRRLVSMAPGFDESIGLWSVEDRRLLFRLAGSSGALQNIEEPERFSLLRFSADEERLITGSTYGALRLWSTETGELIQDFQHPDEVFGVLLDLVESAAISQDGSLVATAHGPAVRLWDVPTGELLVEYRGHDRRAEITSLVFEPGTGTLLSTAQDGVFRWSVPSVEGDLEAVNAWAEARAAAAR